MRVTSWLTNWWAAQTLLTHPQHQQRNVFWLLRTKRQPHLVQQSLHLLTVLITLHTRICLDCCTENTPSGTFIYSNIQNSPVIMNIENSKECCNYRSEREHNFIDPSIQPSAATRIWFFREERHNILPLSPTVY